MNPENRTMLKVTVKDAEESDRMFEILMGEDVPDRRAFIERHAKEVTNLTSDEIEDNEEDAGMPDASLLNRSLNEEMKNSYINYAMSVIIGKLTRCKRRSEAVHRRVLYGMHEGGHTADKKFSKSARSVGEVMGKYHLMVTNPSMIQWSEWLRSSHCATHLLTDKGTSVR